MELSQNKEYMKKHKFSPSNHHLLIQYHYRNYLLLFSTTGVLSLFLCEEQNFTCMATQHLELKSVVGLFNGHQNNICLLTKTSVLFWDIDQFTKKYPPMRFELETSLYPSGLIHLKNKMYLLICEDRTIREMNGNIVKKIYRSPNEMDIQSVIIHPNRSEHLPFLMVPSSNAIYPLLFDEQDLALWSQELFLENHVKKYNKYYMKDQIFPEKVSVLSFSPEQKIVCAWIDKLIMLFNISSEQEQNLKYCLNLRLSVKINSNEPLSCSLNQQTGVLVYAGKERMGQANYLNYRISIKTIRQKKDGNSLVKYIYSFGNNEILLLTQESLINETKVYMCKIGFAQ